MTPQIENDNTLEFNVNMTCGNCEKKVAASLESAGVRDYFIDVQTQKVLVTSSKTSDELREVIESSGKIAVLTGCGGGKVRSVEGCRSTPFVYHPLMSTIVMIYLFNCVTFKQI